MLRVLLLRRETISYSFKILNCIAELSFEDLFILFYDVKFFQAAFKLMCEILN